MSVDDRADILLEVGTNEIEIMEFTINNDTFGINVAKVKEIMMPTKVKVMPQSHPAIEGVFKPRDQVVSVVNLPLYLGVDNESEKSLFIVTSFNSIDIVFRVDTVVGIHRISWSDIQKPGDTVYGGSDGVATGIAKLDGRLITILDFEKIIADICPAISIQTEEIDELGEREKKDTKVLMAEDSILLTKLIKSSIIKSGYEDTHNFNNGQELYDFLMEVKEDGTIRENVDIIITDIEMPLMDGHRLTKLIKDDPELNHIPVIIFSSLISEAMKRKGESVGADAQLTKPEIGNLVLVMDKLLLENEHHA